jgi:hypothetical protein
MQRMEDRKNELLKLVEKMDDYQLRFILSLIKKMFFPEG